MQQCYTGRCLMHCMLKVMLLTDLQKGHGPYSLYTKTGYDSTIILECVASLTSLCHALLQPRKVLSSTCYLFPLQIMYRATNALVGQVVKSLVSLEQSLRFESCEF